ncbi:MAG: hypothetical protein RML40_06070 [Bacteroidota bacterium]|nr:hypothetical protein [Bacteroidota bacterium]
MKTYPILHVSETYLRQALYDHLSAEVRNRITFEEFREYVDHEDYRYFASALSDLLNDYVHEHNIFNEFVSQAAVETISRSEKLSAIYVPRYAPGTENSSGLHEDS